METALLLAAAGATLVFAFGAGVLFRRYRVPDIPLLLGLGGVLAWWGVAEPDAVAQGIPLLAAVALVMVLFDSALEVTPEALRSHGRAGFLMAGATFTMTTLLCSSVAHWVAGLPWDVSVLLGMCFGGAGIVIIIPLAKRLDLSPGGMSVLLMEAITSDILVIVVVGASATVLLAGALDAVAIAFVRTVALGAVGAPLGWLWGRLISHRMENAYAVTLAVLLLVYAATEALGGSGPLAVLLFGLFVARAMRRQRTRMQRATDAQLIEFHHEAMFLVRAFFFVGLGVTTRWELLGNARFLGVGLLLTAAIVASRTTAVATTLRVPLDQWDRTTIALMFPMGLVTAAASLLPQSAGVPGTALLDEYAAVVIVLSNIVAAAAVVVAVRMRPKAVAHT